MIGPAESSRSLQRIAGVSARRFAFSGIVGQQAHGHCPGQPHRGHQQQPVVPRTRFQSRSDALRRPWPAQEQPAQTMSTVRDCASLLSIAGVRWFPCPCRSPAFAFWRSCFPSLTIEDRAQAAWQSSLRTLVIFQSSLIGQHAKMNQASDLKSPQQRYIQRGAHGFELQLKLSQLESADRIIGRSTPFLNLRLF